jgi:hypothetical protein
MHDCLVTMKDGRKFCGPVWEFKPEQGYLTIPSDAKAPDKIFLRDIATAMTRVRTTHGVESTRDLVQVARERGWDGT